MTYLLAALLVGLVAPLAPAPPHRPKPPPEVGPGQWVLTWEQAGGRITLAPNGAYHCRWGASDWYGSWAWDSADAHPARPRKQRWGVLAELARAARRAAPGRGHRRGKTGAGAAAEGREVTEQQWGTSTDIHRMLSGWLLSAPLRPARNRMRLFARGVIALAAAAPWQVLRLAEEAGRGEISDRQLAEAQEALRQDPDIILTLPAALLLAPDSAAQAGHAFQWAMAFGPQSLRDALPDLLRCIFPNPFPSPFGAPARPKLPHCPTCGGVGQVPIPQSRWGIQRCDACLGTGSQPSCAALARAAYDLRRRGLATAAPAGRCPPGRPLCRSEPPRTLARARPPCPRLLGAGPGPGKGVRAK
jgi:hypothetical protein